MFAFTPHVLKRLSSVLSNVCCAAAILSASWGAIVVSGRTQTGCQKCWQFAEMPRVYPVIIEYSLQCNTRERVNDQ